MNAEEAANLCRLAKTISPGQAVDEYTPAAWALILEDYRYEDGREALKQLGGEQQWLHVSQIVARVKRIRRDRVNDYGPLPQPPASIDPDDWRAIQRWQADTTRRIADGQPVERPPARVVEQRRDVRALGEVGTSVRDQERAAARARIAASRAAQKAAPELLLSPSEHSREPQRRTTTEHQESA